MNENALPGWLDQPGRAFIMRYYGRVWEAAPHTKEIRGKAAASAAAPVRRADGDIGPYAPSE